MDFNASPFSRYDTPHNTEAAEVRTRIAKWAAVNGGTDHMFFAVCLNEALIGYSAFHRRGDGYEIGYCFHSAHHGKGYAKESHTALFEYFGAMGITKFTAGTALKNTPSVWLLISLGFALVGTEEVSFYQDAGGNDIVFEGGLFELDTAHQNRVE